MANVHDALSDNVSNVKAANNHNEIRNDDKELAFVDAVFTNNDFLSWNESEDVAFTAGDVFLKNKTGDVMFDAYDVDAYGNYYGELYYYNGNFTYGMDLDYYFTDFDNFMKFETTCAYVLLSIIIVGVIGNVVTFIVFHKGKVCGSSWCALYFKILACADIYVLLSSGLRRSLLGIKRFELYTLHDVLCKYGWFNYYLCVQISTWTTVAITIDRAMSVKFPLKFQKISTSRWIWAKIAVIVVVFVAMNLVVLVKTKLEEYADEYGEYKLCEFPSVWQWYDFMSYGVMVFFIPAVINGVCNVILLRALYQRASNSNLAGINVTTRRNLANYVTYRVVAIGVVHFLSTLPKTIDLSMRKNSPLEPTKSFYLYTISELFFYFNSGLNFLLYCITGMDFRKDLKVMLTKPGPPSRADMTSEL